MVATDPFSSIVAELTYKALHGNELWVDRCVL